MAVLSPVQPAYEIESVTGTEFNRQDTLGRGYLDAAQFRRALSQIAFRLNSHKIFTGPWFDALFAELDRDCDGLLSFTDFEAAVNDLLQFEFRKTDDEWRLYAHRRKQESAAGDWRIAAPFGQGPRPAVPFGAAGPMSGLQGSYDVVKGGSLGQGAFGTVVIVRHRYTGAERACKSVPLDTAQAVELVQSEIAVLTQLDHVNVMRLYDVYFEDAVVYLVTELCGGGSLGERLSHHRDVLREPMPEARATYYLEQMLSATGYCHERGVVHRDLKPDNVLFVCRAGDSALKVIDFGLAETFERLQQTRRVEMVPREGALGAVARLLPRMPDGKELISTQVSRTAMQRAGTPHYMAPEVYAGEYGPKADIFSIGCMAVEMLSGTHPFYVPGRDDLESIRRKIVSENPNLGDLFVAGASPQALKLSSWMLEKRPEGRASAKEALADEWFSQFVRLAARGALTLSAACVRAALVRFAAGGRLRQAVLRALARELMENQVQGLRQAFLHLDRDGDGVLSLTDLGAEDSDVAEVHMAIDQVGTGSGRVRGLGYSDFVAVLLPQRVTMRPQQLACAFERLDADCSGYLTGGSLQQAVARNHGVYGSTISPGLLRDAAYELDAIGGLDLPRFCRVAQVAASSDRTY